MGNTSAILLAVMVIATASMAHGITLDGITVAEVNIKGDVKCMVAGNPVPQGIPGVTMSVTCNKGQITLGQAISDDLGVINIAIKGPDTTVVDKSQCFANAAISVGTCADAPPTGNLQLQGNLDPVSLTTEAPVGAVANFIIVSLRQVGT